MADKKTDIVLLQLGGPDSLEAVEPFLFNLFCDPDIIDLPLAFLFRKRLARLISSKRAPKVCELYKTIGGKSPIAAQTRLQAEALQSSLNEQGRQVGVHVAMRYWHPMTDRAVEDVIERSPDQVILLPLYPHFSVATTGSGFKEWDRVAKQKSMNGIEVKRIKEYFDHPLYIEALIDRIQIALRRVPDKDRKRVHLVFSAHGTPMKLVHNGDPYSHQIRKTYDLVVQGGNFGLPHTLCFQSKVGPQKWLEPSLTGTIEELARQKVSHVVVIPIAFVTDHIETLSEINIEVKAEALKAGIRYFDMTPALIRSKKFIACLSDLVMKHL